MEIDEINQNKKRQIIELILVVGVAFYQSIIISIQSIFTDKPVYSYSQLGFFTFLISYVNVALSIFLMLYVLKRQGKTILNIGVIFPVTRKDLGHSICLILICSLASALPRLLLYHISPDWYNQAIHPRNLDFMRSDYLGYLFLYVILIPLKEELIVRGYTMEQMMEISNRKNIAILISVGIQFSYHLYQGIPSAITLIPTFLIFAVYYSRSGNLNPIILAHIAIDLLGLSHLRNGN